MAIDAAREGLFEFREFKGLRNTVDARDFESGDLETALNVDIDDGLNITRRKGYSTAVVAGVDRCLFAEGSICLGVGSNVLKQILPDYSTVTLRTGLSAGRPLSYSRVANRVYYANGVETGVVENGQSRTWGLTLPGHPTLASTTGSMRAGRYQVVITYIRSDGQESGAGRAAVIELASTGGVAITAIPVSTDSSVTHKSVYCTATNGATLIRIGTILNATTTFDIREMPDISAPLTTQHLSPPPAGEYIAYSNSHMLVAVDSALYPSEPFAPELFDYRKRVPFLSAITMVAPLNNESDGVWIGTEDEIVWLSGATPETWTYLTKADYGVIPGTQAYADGEVLGDGSGTGAQCVFFMTKNGVCAGMTGGRLLNMTQERFAIPAMDTGAGVVRKHRGTIQYVSVLQGVEAAANSHS